METEATPAAAAAAHMCNGDANKRSRPDQEGDASQPQTNGMFVFFLCQLRTQVCRALLPLDMVFNSSKYVCNMCVFYF